MKKNKHYDGDKSYKNVIITIIFISFLVFFVIGISFATFISSQEGTKDNTIKSGTISMTYTEDINGIMIDNAMPLSDAAGKLLSGQNQYFDFTVNTKIVGQTSVTYEVAAIKDNSSTLNDSDIKLYLEKQSSGSYEEILAPSNYKALSKTTEIGSPMGSMVLTKVTTKSSSTDNYRLRMWLADTATIDSIAKTYTVRINIYGKAK